MCSQDMYRKYEMAKCQRCEQRFNEHQNVIAQTEYVRKVRCPQCGTVQIQVKCQYVTKGGMCLFSHDELRACLEERCPFAHSCKGCKHFETPMSNGSDCLDYCNLGHAVTRVETPVFPCSYRREKKQ
jgi:hypothetical protein